MIISFLIVWEIVALLASGILLMLVGPDLKEDYIFSFAMGHTVLWGTLGLIGLCSWIISLNL